MNSKTPPVMTINLIVYQDGTTHLTATRLIGKPEPPALVIDADYTNAQDLTAFITDLVAQIAPTP